MEVIWPPSHWGRSPTVGAREVLGKLGPGQLGLRAQTVRPQNVDSWAEVNISTYPGTFGPWIIFFFLVQFYSDLGVWCRNIAQEQLCVTQSCSARKTIKSSLFGFNSIGPFNHGKEGNKVLCDTV